MKRYTLMEQGDTALIEMLDGEFVRYEACKDSNMKNYDPNLVASGRMAMQTVSLVFQQWQYSAKTYVDVGGNCLGAEIIDCAISQAYEELTQNVYGKTHITMHLYGCSGGTSNYHTGETLIVVDEEQEGEDWLAKMLVRFEITDIVTWDGSRDKDEPSPMLKQKSELKKQPPISTQIKAKPVVAASGNFFYFAIRSPGRIDTVRIAKAVTPDDAYQSTFGGTLSEYEWKNLGSRLSVVQSDKKRIKLLADTNDWHKARG